MQGSCARDERSKMPRGESVEVTTTRANYSCGRTGSFTDYPPFPASIAGDPLTVKTTKDLRGHTDRARQSIGPLVPAQYQTLDEAQR
jgi:hypothetical protein